LLDNQPVGAALNRNLGSPTAPGEATEAELDRLIERRSRQKDPDEESKAWQESVRRYNARRREAVLLAWCDYFERLSACLRARAAEYDQRAQTLMETDQPKGAAYWRIF
jgi:hypothetical protein